MPGKGIVDPPGQSGYDPRVLRFLLNLVWILTGGLVIALEYFVGGLILCLTVVGIPFGLQCFKLAEMSLVPFGKDVVDEPMSGAGDGALRLIMNLIWLVVAGIWICLSHLGLALGLAVTLIGIPFAVKHLKLALVSLMPFGKAIINLPD